MWSTQYQRNHAYPVLIVAEPYMAKKRVITPKLAPLSDPPLMVSEERLVRGLFTNVTVPGPETLSGTLKLANALQVLVPGPPKTSAAKLLALEKEVVMALVEVMTTVAENAPPLMVPALIDPL
jgi:hypothetical protein